MARHVLVGPRDEGRSSYQIALSVCPQCSSAHQAANGQLVPVDAEIVEMAECDGQHLPAPKHPTRKPAAPHVGARAKQTIPPALRRAVLHRDGHRCRVPGCKNATFLDLHHLQPRSDGGRHEAANLLTVCSAHHRALHRGRLRIEGNADAPSVLHSDGRAYGQLATPGTLEVQRKVFSALHGLGFRESEVRTAMAELRQRAGLCETSAEQWLREALRRLHRPPAH
jgi:5-methylcytosine-specific restriction endonuclease McrA